MEIYDFDHVTAVEISHCDLIESEKGSVSPYEVVVRISPDSPSCCQYDLLIRFGSVTFFQVKRLPYVDHDTFYLLDLNRDPTLLQAICPYLLKGYPDDWPIQGYIYGDLHVDVSDAELLVFSQTVDIEFVPPRPARAQVNLD